MRELQTGVWHWQASHPDWQEGEPWDRNVSSYAIDDGDRLLLFDPIAPPSELEELARERETAVVLTCPWHERDTQGLVERLGVPVFTPRPDSAQYAGDPDFERLISTLKRISPEFRALWPRRDVLRSLSMSSPVRLAARTHAIHNSGTAISNVKMPMNRAIPFIRSSRTSVGGRAA